MKKEMKKVLALLSIVALVSCGGSQQKPVDFVKDSTWNGVVVEDSTNKQDTLSTPDTTSGLKKVAENVK